MSGGMIEISSLPVKDRHLLNDLAADARVTPSAFGVAVIEAYFRLLRDAPNALPASGVGLRATLSRNVSKG